MHDDTLICKYEQAQRDITVFLGQIDALEYSIYTFECSIKKARKRAGRLERQLRERGLWPLSADVAGEGDDA